MEQADRVRPAAHAGEKEVRQAAFGFEDLGASLAPDDGLKIAHHLRIGMRAEHRAEQVVRGADVGDPVAHGLVDSILERAAAGVHSHDFGAELSHAKNIKPLALHVLGAHVHHALEAQARRHRGGSYTVLTGAGFRDDAWLAHAHGEQALAQAVIDLVRAGVKQVFALQKDAWAAEVSRQARRKLQRRGTPGEIPQQVFQLVAEGSVRARLAVSALELFEGRHQCFRHITPAVRTEAAAGIGPGLRGGAHRFLCPSIPRRLWLAASTSRINSRRRAGSFFPGFASTPLQMSIANGRTTPMASATFSAVRPPASTTGP